MITLSSSIAVQRMLLMATSDSTNRNYLVNTYLVNEKCVLIDSLQFSLRHILENRCLTCISSDMYEQSDRQFFKILLYSSSWTTCICDQKYSSLTSVRLSPQFSTKKLYKLFTFSLLDMYKNILFLVVLLKFTTR